MGFADATGRGLGWCKMQTAEIHFSPANVNLNIFVPFSAFCFLINDNKFGKFGQRYRKVYLSHICHFSNLNDSYSNVTQNRMYKSFIYFFVLSDLGAAALATENRIEHGHGYTTNTFEPPQTYARIIRSTQVKI